MKYLLRLIIAALLVCTFSYLGNKLYKRSNLFYSNQFQKNDTLFNHHINADILLLGSSRIYNTINPKMLEDSLRRTVYNAAMPGANIREQLLILRSFLQRNTKPEIIVSGLDLFSMDVEHPFGFYGSYLYNIQNNYVNSEMKKDKKKVGLYGLFPFLVATEFDDYYRGNVLKALRKQTEVSPGDFIYHGYLSNTADSLTMEPTAEHKVAIKVQQNGLDSLQSLITLCRQNNIRLFLTYSPEYKQLNIKSAVNADSLFGLYNNVAH